MPEQERKTRRISLAVNEEERRAVELVAAAGGLTDMSLILRRKSLNQIVREYRKLKAMVGR